MKTKTRKILLIIILVISVPFLAKACFQVGVFTFIFLKMLDPCAQEHYIPPESEDRFVELVFEASQRNDIELLQKVGSEDAITDLTEIARSPYQFVELQNLDWLETTYNYRVILSEGGYFDVYLEYDRWPGECPVEQFSDEAVIAHFFLLRVGELKEP